MLVTSYGFDSAIAQIIYYYTKKDINFVTVSKRSISSFLNKCTPDILLGFNNVSPEMVSKVKMVIDNTKSSEEVFGNVSNSCCKYKTSKSLLLHTYLKSEQSIMRYVNMVDLMNTFDQTITFYDLYMVLGHESFVNRFIMNPEPLLTKHEELLISKYMMFKQAEASMIIDTFASIDENLFITKCNMMMQNLVEKAIFKKNDEISIILFWNFDIDGSIKVVIKSKNDMAGKIAGYFKGNEYYYNGTFNLIVPNEEDIDINYYLKTLVKEAINNIEKESMTNYFDSLQNDLDITEKSTGYEFDFS